MFNGLIQIFKDATFRLLVEMKEGDRPTSIQEVSLNVKASGSQMTFSTHLIHTFIG